MEDKEYVNLYIIGNEEKIQKGIGSDDVSERTSDDSLNNDINGNNSISNNKNEKNKKLMRSWLYSLVVMLLPFLAVPLYALVVSKDMVPQIMKAISGSELAFISVSLLVSLINDLPEISEAKHDKIRVFTVLLIVAVIIYCIMCIGNYIEPGSYNIVTTIILNLMLFATTLVSGIITYIKG